MRVLIAIRNVFGHLIFQLNCLIDVQVRAGSWDILERGLALLVSLYAGIPGIVECLSMEKRSLGFPSLLGLSVSHLFRTELELPHSLLTAMIAFAKTSTWRNFMPPQVAMLHRSLTATVVIGDCRDDLLFATCF